MKNIKGEVSVIGLGPMGIALARALLRNSHRVTVWNRSSEKAEPLVRDGAALASSTAATVRASPIVIVCVADYKASHTILETKEVTPALAGKVLVQLSTGSPQEARDSEAWARERGVYYLDGAILAIPSQIGRPESTILVSGSDTAFRRAEPLLKSMASNVAYLSEQVGSASALDLGFLSFLFGAMLDFYHGAHILESEGLRVDSLGSMLADIAPAIGEMIKHEGEVIQTERYEKPESSLKTSAVAVELLVRQAREAQINSEFPTFASELFRKAMAAGYENEEVAALIKVLREGD